MTILPPGVPRPRVWPRAGAEGSTVFSRPGAASVRQAALWDAIYELAVALNEGGGGGLPPETVQAMIDQSLADHEAEVDPHGVYLTKSETDLLYMPLGSAPDLTNYYTKPEAEARFLDQAEGDARYALVGAGGAVDSVNGYTGVVVLNAADVGALTQAQADGRYATPASVTSAVAAHAAAADPHSVYLLQSEGDSRYSLGTHNHDAAYASSVHTHDARYFTETESDARYSLTAHDHDARYYTESESDAKYATPATVLAGIANHEAAVDPHSAYLTQSEADSRYSPIAGGNVTVLEEEEFAPAAAATTVTLAALPAAVLSVFRNGLEQSLAAGHYTLAGDTLTFSSPFAAGERVAVVYSLGTSVLVDAYTKAQSDALFLTQAEADALFLTQAEADGLFLTPAEGNAAYQPVGSYAPAAHNHDAAYVNTSGGDTLAGPLTVSSGGVAVTGASTFSVAPTVGGSALLTQSAGDARYLQPATAAAAYVELGGDTMTGALTAPGVTIAGKAVALSPNAGQTLQWLANGFYSDSPTKATVDGLTARVATLEAQVATLQGQMGAGASGHYHTMGTWRQTNKATVPVTILEEAPAA